MLNGRSVGSKGLIKELFNLFVVVSVLYLLTNVICLSNTVEPH